MEITEFDEDFLPDWVVETSASDYKIYSKYKLFGEPSYSTSNPEIFALASGYNVTPVTNIEFSRITGDTTATDFTVQIVGVANTVTVSVSNEGNVEVVR